jgi:uncharacterized damage-inducible protein DinB
LQFALEIKGGNLFMGLNEPILAEFQQEAKTTRKLLERVPQDALGWKPHEKSMTMERLAVHIAELYGWPSIVLASNELDFSRMDYTPPKINGISDLLEFFDKAVTGAVDLLKTQTDEQLVQLWKLRTGEKVFFEMPRLAVIRSMVLNHTIHHRGQLSVYLRLRNVPIPSIYGPSADEPMQ